MKNVVVYLLPVVITACAGMKVVNPNEGTLALDNGKLVGTYTCRLKAMNTSFSAVAKTEAEARKEVVDSCKYRTVISNCKGEITCEKN